MQAPAAARDANCLIVIAILPDFHFGPQPMWEHTDNPSLLETLTVVTASSRCLFCSKLLSIAEK